MITEVTIKLITIPNTSIVGFADVVWDNAIVIRGIAIMTRGQELVLNMPKRKTKAGKLKDVACPISREVFDLFYDAIIKYYREITESDNPPAGEPYSA